MNKKNENRNKKLLAMSVFLAALFFFAQVAFAQENDTAPNLAMGADSPLYGLKRAFEGMQMRFTGNEIAKASLERELPRAKAHGSPWARLWLLWLG